MMAMIRMLKRKIVERTLSPGSRPFLPSSCRRNPVRLPAFPDVGYHRILDPGSEIVIQWNKIFLVSGLVALFIDPLYFYIPSFIPSSACLNTDFGLGIAVTFFRCFADLFYLAHMLMKFRTAFIAPSSRVFGRGELVMDEREIAMRYLKSDFFLDLAAMLPLPQFIIWFLIPAVKRASAKYTNNTLSLIVLIQYVPRLFLIFPLTSQITKTTGAVTKTAWAGAAYNLILYLIASHLLGASWYLLSLERQHTCWKIECMKEDGSMDMPSCDPSFLDCSNLGEPGRNSWLNATHVFRNCDAMDRNIEFKYGMFSDALTNGIISSKFTRKYLYCLSWGLRNLSSYGTNLETSTFTGETLFCILICIVGLVIFAHLMGNMETYLQSITVRLEEWRVRRRDTEEWMRHRQLPPDLQDRIRRFNQYEWLATRGVDEESILHSLPLDLRRDIQRHLCLALVRRVPFFSQMDDQLLDAICGLLVSSLNTPDAYIVREGDPVNEMLFIIRGQLESSTTDGGRSGFFNSIMLRPGDFCGEELLTWALMPNSTLNLPSSTRTVRSLTEVEAFALGAEDLKFVAHQFKRLQSKKLQHAFRYYSHQWRTWSARFIQAAWRRFQKRKLAEELEKQESLYYKPLLDSRQSTYYEYEDVPLDDYEDDDAAIDNQSNLQQLNATILASKFAKNTKRGVNQKRSGPSAASLKMPKLLKPNEPDFSMEADDYE